MHKMVNGVVVPLTDQEIAEFNQREQEHLQKIEEYKKIAYLDKRREEFNKRGCTIEALNVALWERIVEGKPESSDTLQIIREAVKQEIPKPLDIEK